jgi:membrane dipeptidase
MAGLTWNGDNALGGGRSTHNGLTELGVKAVARLEDARIAVDAAHLSTESFADLVKCRKRPFLISHCASRAVCDVDRNVTDDQFKAVLDSGGVVGVSYCTEFITKRTTGTDVTFDELMAHFEHFLDLGGKDGVCLGGDFDGASVPDWLRGVDKLQGFYQKMCERLGQEQTDKVFFQNAYAFMVRNEVA